jgi:hypothetical protein
LWRKFAKLVSGLTRNTRLTEPNSFRFSPERGVGPTPTEDQGVCAYEQHPRGWHLPR